VKIKLVSLAKKHAMTAYSEAEKRPHIFFTLIPKGTGIYFRADIPGKEGTFLPNEWENASS